MKRNGSKLYSILSILLIVAVLLSVVGVIMRYTNNGSTDFALFYVAYDGQDIMTDTTVSLNDGETATFVPKYSADDIMHAVGQTTETKDYNVKILPNITKETSFTYQVGDSNYRFAKLADTDFSEAFHLKKEEKAFSIKVDEFTIENVLSVQHENKPVTLPENFDYKQSYFNLIISSYDEKNSVVLGLKPAPFVFMIDGQEFQAERGMTYGEWKKSNYCSFDLLNDGRLQINGFAYDLYDNQKDGTALTNDIKLEKGCEYFAANALTPFWLDYNQYYTPYYTTLKQWAASDFCPIRIIGNCKQFDGNLYPICYSDETTQGLIYKHSSNELKEEDFIESKKYYAIPVLYEACIESYAGVFSGTEYQFFVSLYTNWGDYISNLPSAEGGFRIETDGRVCYDKLVSFNSQTGETFYQRYFVVDKNGGYVRSTDSVICSFETMSKYELVSGYTVGYDSDGNRIS